MILDPGGLAAADRLRVLSACVSPRPIALVSTLSPCGVCNVAPFSMYTLLSASPALVGLSLMPRAGQDKDTLRNVEAGGDFVVNGVTAELLDAAIAASADFPADVSEADAAGLQVVASTRVKAPRLAASPFHLECRRVDVLRFAGSEASFLVGEIVLVHVDDRWVRDGEIDLERIRPVGHLTSGPEGYRFGMMETVIRRPPAPALGR